MNKHSIKSQLELYKKKHQQKYKQTQDKEKNKEFENFIRNNIPIWEEKCIEQFKCTQEEAKSLVDHVALNKKIVYQNNSVPTIPSHKKYKWNLENKNNKDFNVFQCVLKCNPNNDSNNNKFEYYETDLRIIFAGQEFEIKKSINKNKFNIPYSDLCITDIEYNHLNNIWNIINPYKNIQSVTSMISLQISRPTISKLSFMNATNSNINNHMITSKFSDTQCENSWAHGAHPVSLPSTIANNILKVLINQNIITDALPIITIEISSEKSPLRVYGYCCNPDYESNHGQIYIDKFMQDMLNCTFGDFVNIRVVTPPHPPKPSDVGISIMPMCNIDSKYNNDEIKKSLIESFYHQKVIFLNQIIYLYLSNVMENGPIPYRITKLYTEDRKGTIPTPVLNIHGCKNGIECGIDVEQKIYKHKNGKEFIDNIYADINKREKNFCPDFSLIVEPTVESRSKCVLDTLN